MTSQRAGDPRVLSWQPRNQRRQAARATRRSATWRAQREAWQRRRRSVDLFTPNAEELTALHDLAQTRYLNYALSVITSRALPDVRDGLKPVQRRILYAMWTAAPLRRREAPQVRHGRRRRDGRLPPARRLLDLRGAGPHGAGLRAAGAARRRARATSARSTAIPPRRCATPSASLAAALAPSSSTELDQATVRCAPELRRHEDGAGRPAGGCRTSSSTARPGIAVGMATNIPPHNPEEVCARRAA